jgi:transposase
MAGKKIDEETKIKVRESYGNGVPKKRIAEQFSISVSSVSRIIREGPPAKSPGESKKEGQQETRKTEIRKKKIADIERRIAELEQKILRLQAGKKTEDCWFRSKDEK